MLTEIDDAVKLLPFLVEKDKKASSSQEVEQVLQHYKNENDQLRRFVEGSQFSYSSSSLQFRRKYEMIWKLVPNIKLKTAGEVHASREIRRALDTRGASKTSCDSLVSHFLRVSCFIKLHPTILQMRAQSPYCMPISDPLTIYNCFFLATRTILWLCNETIPESLLLASK